MTSSDPQWVLDCLRRQNDINSYARQRYQPRLRAVERILIYHPDEHRRYLRQHPCEGCIAESFCDLPCEVYLKWYNARLEAARKKGT